MTAYKKVMIIVFSLLTAFIAIGTILILTLMDSQTIKQNIQEKISVASGKNVKIGHLTLHPSFPNLLIFRVEGLDITDTNDQSILSVKKISFVPSWLPLFKGEIAIKSITIEDALSHIIRAVDGSILNVVMAAPARSPESQKQEVAEPQPESPKKARDLRWRIDNIEIHNAKVRFTDKRVNSPNDVEYTGVFNGVMNGDPSTDIFTSKIQGKVGQNETLSQLELQGIVQLTPDLKAISQANFQLKIENLSPRLASPYIPDKFKAVEEFQKMDISVKGLLEKSKPGGIEVQANIFSESDKPANIKLSSKIKVNATLDTLDSIEGDIQFENLGLGKFAEYYAFRIPALKSAGVLSGTLKGNWESNDHWNTKGDLSLQSISLTPGFKHIETQLNLNTKFTADPTVLNIESLDLKDSKNKFSIVGKIVSPLDDSRAGDFKLEFSLVPEFLKAIGVPLPKEFKFKGEIPIHGSVKGKQESLNFDIRSDLKSAGLEWQDLFEKPLGTPGAIVVKGRIRPNHTPLLDTIHVDAQVSNATVIVNKQQLSGAIQLTSEVIPKNKGMDLRNTTANLKRQGHSVLNFRGDILGIGLGNPDFDGGFTLAINKEIVNLINKDSQIALDGSSLLNGKVSGNSKRSRLIIDLPVTGLSISHGKDFKKPLGIPGNIHATMQIAGDTVEMSSGNVTLPGIVLLAKGTLKDSAGKMNLNLNLSKGDLKEASKLMPQLEINKTSGSVTGTIQLISTDHKIQPTGSIKLKGLYIKPENTGVAFEDVQASINLAGNDISVPNLNGRITGSVESPIKMNGNFQNIENVSDLNGKFTLNGGPGVIRSDKLNKILQQTNVISQLLQGSANGKKNDPMSFQSLNGDFVIQKGIMRTDDLQFKGAIVNAGVMGNLELKSSEMDALLGIKTASNFGQNLNKLPAVQKILKQNEGLLKATGLDKELKRLGIGSPDEPKAEENKSETTTENQMQSTKFFLFLKLSGSAASPSIVPVIENQKNRASILKLKSLIEG